MGTEIIAEIASSHQGSDQNIYELINYLHKNNHKLIKFQIFDLKCILHPNDNTSDLHKIYISPTIWNAIIEYSIALDLKIILEIYDLKSFNLINHNPKIYGYKIPTADIFDLDLINAVCNISKNVYIGTGGSLIDEIDDLMNTLLKNYPGIKLTLLHVFQNFPTKPEITELNKIKFLKSKFPNCFVGYADHMDASTTSRNILCFMSLSLGVDVIEKHITLKREQQGFDYYSSLNPDEFIQFCKDVKVYEQSLNIHNDHKLSKEEELYRNKMKKYAVLIEDSYAGDDLNLRNIIFVRVDKKGLSRKYFINKNLKFKSNLKIGHILSEDDLEHF